MAGPSAQQIPYGMDGIHMELASIPPGIRLECGGTVKTSTLRIIMAMAAVEDLELHSVDITSAFTNGDLDEEIYMKQPEGFHIGGPNKVCRLSKSLYGLKQSARQWNKKLHSVLTELGFKRIESDCSVYI